MKKDLKLLFSLLSLLLLSWTRSYAQYDIVVAKDGSGNYTTVQAAINAAPSNSAARTVIYIKNGSYYEVITVPTNKTNLTLIGQSNTGTVLTYDNAASKINPATGQAYGTSNSASQFINGAGFYALNIAFANTASPSLGQAVAVRCTADKAIFRNCRFLGNQDTYYAHSGRAYHESCYFEGTTDFIFGGAIGFFENCDIYCKGGTSVTAASTAQNIQYGYVFNNCRITGAGTAITDLGRPWGAYASVTFRNTSMSAAIKAAGWNDWGNSANQATARFSEYSNSGSGYVPASRPSWVHILTASQATPYTMLNILKANNANPQVTDNWNPLTTINATGGSSISAFSTIQAESYNSMSGVQTETCSEGGLDVGFIHNNDWIRFGSVNFGSGVSGFSARVASNTTGGTIKLRIDAAGGTQIGSCNVANTGGWQTWTTVSSAASGVSGVHDLYLTFSGTTTDYLFNLNYFVFTAGSARLETAGTSTEPVDNRIQIFPSPAEQEITLEIGEQLNKDAHLVIYDNLGRQVYASTLKANISKIPVGSFSPGAYIVRLFNGQHLVTKKFLKK